VSGDKYYYNENKTLNAFPLTRVYDADISAQIEASPLLNMGYFSWYLNSSYTNYSQIQNPLTIDNLNIAKNLDIVVRPVYRNGYRLLLYENKSNYVAIAHIFDNDGLFYLFPCPSLNLQFNFSTLALDPTCLASNGNAGPAICSSYYLETKKYVTELNKTLFISPPYPLNTTAYNTDLALMACQATLNGNSTIKMITCIMANVTDLALHLNASSACQLGEVTLLVYNESGAVGDVILRAGNTMNFSTFFANPNQSSLMNWEFNVII